MTQGNYAARLLPMVEVDSLPIRYPDFAKRLQKAMAEAPIDRQGVVDFFKSQDTSITYEMVRRWTFGMAMPRQKKLDLLAKAVGCHAAELVYGAEGRDLHTSSESNGHIESNVREGPSMYGPYPLISEVQAGEWTELCNLFEAGDAEEWLSSARNLGPHGYLLRVNGESMKNPDGRYSFSEGMILHVNPDLDPLPGQFVVVRREGTEQAVFKRYVKLDGEPYLEAINPEWPKDRKYLKLQEGDTWCGVVMDASLGNLP